MFCGKVCLFVSLEQEKQIAAYDEFEDVFAASSVVWLSSLRFLLFHRRNFRFGMIGLVRVVEYRHVYASDQITHDLARSTVANTELNGFHETAVTAAALRTNKPPDLGCEKILFCFLVVWWRILRR